MVVGLLFSLVLVLSESPLSLPSLLSSLDASLVILDVLNVSPYLQVLTLNSYVGWLSYQNLILADVRNSYFGDRTCAAEIMGFVGSTSLKSLTV